MHRVWHRYEAAERAGAELVLMLPARLPQHHVTMRGRIDRLRRELDGLNGSRIRIEVVPWAVPPNLSSGVPRHLNRERAGGCCGAHEFIKLHALGLSRYDAVLNVDNEVWNRGDMGRYGEICGDAGTSSAAWRTRCSTWTTRCGL